MATPARAPTSGARAGPSIRSLGPSKVRQWIVTGHGAGVAASTCRGSSRANAYNASLLAALRGDLGIEACIVRATPPNADIKYSRRRIMIRSVPPRWVGEQHVVRT